MKILIAGIGNIFQGDDAFGCKVIRELAHADLPPHVTVTDFGMSGYDLAYALTDGYDLAIMVDAVPCQKSPGTVYLIEPDLDRLNDLVPAPVDAHSLNPVTVLQMARSVGGLGKKLLLVGCEPASLESVDGEIGLSEPVRRAIPEAVGMIRSLVTEALTGNLKTLEPVLT
jgi:hydrogenase maturation protease